MRLSVRVLVSLLLATAGIPSLSARVPTTPKPIVQEASVVKPNWVFHRKFSYKKDQKLNGPKRVDTRPNQTFEIPTSGEKGFWEIVPRSDRRSYTDVWILSIPQDDAQEAIISYEIPMTRGRFQPAAIRFAPEGTIYLINNRLGASKDPKTKGKMKIGTFKVDMKTLPPIIDRAFTSYNK